MAEIHMMEEKEMEKVTLQKTRSHQMLERAQRCLVGGVNSPVRAFQAVGGVPLVVDLAKGSRMFDVDGREYIDYVCSWGATFLGHAHPAVVSAIAEQAGLGISYGMTSPHEVELADVICKALPAVDKIRFVSSGTEAAMSAIRLARAHTERELIIKFEGCYHGHADSFLAKAGSGLATLGIASSPGVPVGAASATLNAKYNDLSSVERLFEEFPDRVAAVIVEPVAANMGVVPPRDGFLNGLRRLTQREGALLVFDEVITGFRLEYGGAQTLYQIDPDLTILGKIIGGGLPAAAYGGRNEIMQRIAPLGPVYQAGTLSGNPVAMSSGLATLNALKMGGTYLSANRCAAALALGLSEAARQTGNKICINLVGSLLTIFFQNGPVWNFGDSCVSDSNLFSKFFRGMLNRGVLLPPSQFEALFVSGAHTASDIQLTIQAARETFTEMAHPSS